ncbi:MAG: lytic transglycosylase domain-containing protein [Pseudomonadota bacterium]
MKLGSKLTLVTAGMAVLTGLTESLSAQAPANGQMVAHYETPFGNVAQRGRVLPSVLSNKQRKRYQRVFAAIDAQDWETVEQLLEDARGDVLYQVALAEYFTHAQSPRIAGERIARWMEDGVHLPHAPQLGRMGAKRGVEYLPDFPIKQSLRYQPAASKRIRPRTVRDGSMPDSARSDILSAIKNDDPRGAYAVLLEVDAQLSAEARAEWRQRVAWSFYIENDDENALALAETVLAGSGAWVAEGDWVAGLAAWRLGDCERSAAAFARAAGGSTNPELTSAAHYWTHRAMVRCRQPGEAQAHLHAAARFDETLYGMLANDQLGLEARSTANDGAFSEADWRALENRPNVRVAAALIEVGRASLADEVLRHEARIGGAQAYASLARLSRALGLPSTQLFMAHHAPYGMRADPSLRYPVAGWRPKTGWRVDPALAFAHALQESNFRASAVSPANARGLMQIRPGTARDHNRRLNLGATYADLNDPEVNLTYGQQHLEMLRDAGATGGKLPKIMAAYNAGLSPVTRWNSEIRDFDDPLLWMESIPYWETRGYVAIVMRNYWMYERAAGLPSPSRRALAQGLWPEFPVLSNVRRAQLERAE